MMRELRLPASRAELATLVAGEELALTGTVYTARDAAHALIAEAFECDGELPFRLEGATVFYAGPTPPAAGLSAGAIGPTTAKRMDAWTPKLLEAGIVATIGKGARSREVAAACVATGSVYLAAVGGAAAMLARHVTSSEVVAWPELGTEALRRVTLDRFPVFVAIDTRGGDLYAEAPGAWRTT
jgi:fumarate hydratase class I/fumarate hydratase subunit beta